MEDPPSSGWLPVDPANTSFSRGIASLLGRGIFVLSGGRSHAYEDLASWLAEAGFPEVEHEPIKESPGFSPVVARR